VISSHGISRLGGDDFDVAIAALAASKRGCAVTAELLEAVRAQKEAIGPNSRKVVVALDDAPVILPIDEVYEACAGLVDQTFVAMEPAMRDPGRAGDSVPWSELAGIYVVGGASSFPSVYRRLRERFGTHRVRRSPHPFGACAIGLAIHLDEERGYTLTERLSRHFGVFREASDGVEVSFDVLVPKDTTLPAEVSRRYRAAHNVGHFRFVECGRIDDGKPGGNLAAWDEFRFPFDRALRAADLTSVPVSRIGEGGPIVEESYRCNADGTVEAIVRVPEDGFERTVQLGRR
jgi:molecular chaperone DnaK